MRVSRMNDFSTNLIAYALPTVAEKYVNFLYEQEEFVEMLNDYARKVVQKELGRPDDDQGMELVMKMCSALVKHSFVVYSDKSKDICILPDVANNDSL